MPSTTKDYERRLALLRKAEAWFKKQYGDSAPEGVYDYNEVLQAMMRFTDQQLRAKVRG